MAENEIAQNSESRLEQSAASEGAGFNAAELQSTGSDNQQQMKDATDNMVQSNQLPGLQLTDSANNPQGAQSQSGSPMEGKGPAGADNSQTQMNKDGKLEAQEPEDGANSQAQTSKVGAKMEAQEPSGTCPDKSDEKKEKSDEDDESKYQDPSKDGAGLQNPAEQSEQSPDDNFQKPGPDGTGMQNPGGQSEQKGDDPNSRNPGQDANSSLGRNGTPGQESAGPVHPDKAATGDGKPGQDGVGPVTPEGCENGKEADPNALKKDETDHKTIEAKATLPGLEITGLDGFNAKRKATV